jgi:hypothetical protein
MCLAAFIAVIVLDTGVLTSLIALSLSTVRLFWCRELNALG